MINLYDKLTTEQSAITIIKLYHPYLASLVLQFSHFTEFKQETQPKRTPIKSTAAEISSGSKNHMGLENAIGLS